MSELKDIIVQAKRWAEQERVWDDSLYLTEGRKGEWANRRMGERASERKGDVNGVSPLRRFADSPVRSASPSFAPDLQALHELYKDCVRCPLGQTRIKFVFGVGNPNAEVLFIGEGPGYEEDRRGEPFVGKAGQLLDKMMAAIGLSRQTNAYIANIVKCHPMANPQTPDARNNDRPPSPEEVETCSPILLKQIAIIRPKIIMTLGSPSTKMILKTKDGITGLRGKLFPFLVDAFYPENPEGPVGLDPQTRAILNKTQVLPTYHPAALLRNPNLKPESWTDLKLLRDTLASLRS